MGSAYITIERYDPKSFVTLCSGEHITVEGYATDKFMAYSKMAFNRNSDIIAQGETTGETTSVGQCKRPLIEVS